MSTAFKKTVLAAAAFTLVAIGQAEAAEPEFGDVFIRLEPCLAPCPTRPTVHVAHEDGQWTRVLEDHVTLHLRYGARMEKGYIVDWKVGRPDRSDRVEGDFCPGEPPPVFAQSYIGDATPVCEAPLRPADKQQIIDKCSSDETADNDFIASHDYLIGLQVDAKRRRRWTVNGYKGWGDSARKLATANIPIEVVCEPPTYGAEAPPQPVSVDIQVKSVSETCPKKTHASRCCRERWS